MTVGAVPTYQQFQQVNSLPQFRHMLWTPAIRKIQACIRGGTLKRIARDAMRWRIGIFYYSFLREQWIQAYLREHGVSTRQHPLADALFAVDGWTGDKVISLYIGNRSYRAANGGRKHPRAPASRDGVRLGWFEVEAPVLVAARRA